MCSCRSWNLQSGPHESPTEGEVAPVTHFTDDGTELQRTLKSQGAGLGSTRSGFLATPLPFLRKEDKRQPTLVFSTRNCSSDKTRLEAQFVKWVAEGLLLCRSEAESLWLLNLCPYGTPAPRGSQDPSLQVAQRGDSEGQGSSNTASAERDEDRNVLWGHVKQVRSHLALNKTSLNYPEPWPPWRVFVWKTHLAYFGFKNKTKQP